MPLKPNLPSRPRVSCPSCQALKDADEAICPNCRGRYCPKCRNPFEPESRICSACGWKDHGSTQAANLRKIASSKLGNSQSTIGKMTYICGNVSCGHNPIYNKSDRCPSCGQLGNHIPYDFIGGKEQPPLVSKEYGNVVSHMPNQSSESRVVEAAPPVRHSSFQPEDVAQKDWIHRRPDRNACVSEKTSAKSRRDWYEQSEGISKAKGVTIAGVLVLVIIAAVMWFFVVKPSIPQIASSTPSSPFSSPQPNPPVVVVAPLTISNISISEVTESSAVIRWVTNEKATSQVEYGTTTAYGRMSDLNTELLTEHKVILNALNPNTLYHFKVKSKNASGKIAESNTDNTFITAELPDTTPPMISGIKLIDVSDTTATIAWMTDEEANSQIEYGTSTFYGSMTSADEKLVTNHIVTITGLEADRTYYFKIKSSDAKKNVAVVDVVQPFRTKPPVPTGPEIGKRAPDFTVYTIDGAAVTLSQLRGKIVMVNFWAIGCAACVAEMPDIEAAYKTWSGPKELRIIAINVGDHPIYIRNFIKEQRLSLPVYIDSDRTAVSDYQISRIPRTFFIDSSGIIRKVQMGSFDNQEQIREALNALQ